ncbi:hypothetical protein C8J57DRAFT_1469386 [Mycena rebaudengoi]|nr:hypothetical protein C8J57DRAFT_1469386 [Mycena rebaudengoi]
MTGSPSHPSRTSIDSTTGLTAAYRPPQKDYMAIYATLQDKYGPTGAGHSPRLIASKSAAPPGQFPNKFGGRMVQKIWSKIKSFFRKNERDVPQKNIMPLSLIESEYAPAKSTETHDQVESNQLSTESRTLRGIQRLLVGNKRPTPATMMHSPSNPSRTSFDSTTGLTAAYRPPQKDYAAAYAALQDKYGPPGSGYHPEPVARKSTESRGKMVQKIWSKIKSFFRKNERDGYAPKGTEAQVEPNQAIGNGDGRSTQVWSFKSKFLIKQRAVELRK